MSGNIALYYADIILAGALHHAYSQCGDIQQSCRAHLGGITPCWRSLQRGSQMVWTYGENERSAGKQIVQGKVEGKITRQASKTNVGCCKGM